MILHPARFTLFPYTTLFRSGVDGAPLGFQKDLDAALAAATGVLIVGEPRAECADPAQAIFAALDRPRIVLRPFLGDRKSTRLNSSHLGISYAVFCLKKKK